MLFNTPLFFIFFVVFVFFYGFVFLRKIPRTYFILIASLVFYGAWNWKFIPLLVFSGVADYFIAQAIDASGKQRTRKAWLRLSIAINLGILGLFKYADFVLLSAQDFLRTFGYDVPIPTLEWVLPVGISFYTFQSLSYTIDVYRRDMKARKGLLQFTAALSFFPQLVAGPILRARQILPQMHAIPTPTWEGVRHGFLLITVGLMKKTTADLLAVPVAIAFDGSGPVSLLETWTGVLAFAGQIYGDFSGYSDMAIGLAMLIGFKIPLNFRLPYFAVSPIDFWRRWHISLSSWLRDYLYFSLGGNRTGHRMRNIFITMLLGGLWHGAAWTFIFWGVFHGVIISAAHYLAGIRAFAAFNHSPTRTATFFKWLITFYLVLIGWVLFRANSIGSAFNILGDMHSFSGLPAPAASAALMFALVALAVLLMHLIDRFILLKAAWFQSKWWLFWPSLIIGLTLCLLVGKPSQEFIYFQF